MRDLTSRNGLLIGIPTLGRPVTLEWATNFKAISPPINFNSVNMTLYGCPVAEARNKITEEAIKGNFKYLFFLGDDVIVPPHSLRQLIYRMEQDSSLGVVGGVYFSKSNPSFPLIFKENGGGSYWDWKVGEYFEVTGLGMDCTLIRVEMLKALEKPYFVTIDSDNFIDAINKAEMWTEDLYFLKNVYTKTEYKIYVDTSVICKHVDVYNNRVYTIPSHSLPTRKPLIEKKFKAVDLGCGPINRSDQFPNYDLIRVDIREECEPDYRCDIRQLPFADNEFDLVFSSHVLEHFKRDEFIAVLREWLRILKKDGELQLILPNIKWAAEELLKAENEEKQNDILNVFYGAQTNPFDLHYNGIWPERITEILYNLGFAKDNISIEHQYYNMIIHAKRTSG